MAMIGCGDISQQYLKASRVGDCAEIGVGGDAVGPGRVGGAPGRGGQG